MALNDRVTVPARTWTELTNAEDAGSVVAVQNVGMGNVRLLATTTGTAPADTVTKGWVYAPGQADARSLADMFPGITTPVRLWAWSVTGTHMMVSYG